MSTTTNGHHLRGFDVTHLVRPDLAPAVAPQVPTAAPRPPMLARTWIAISEQRQASKDRKHARRVQAINARATASKTSRPRTQRLAASMLWLREQGLVLLAYVAILGVVYAGWSASFIGLHKYAMVHMGYTDHDAWFVPGAFDGAAVGLTIVVTVEAMNGRGAATWRLLIVAFTGLSSWINYQDIPDHGGRVVAALLPVSAVVLFEGLMSRARRAYEDRVNPGRQKPRFHPLRWLFDFKGTLAILRAYVLDIPLPDTFAAAVETVEQERKPKGKRTRNTARKPARKPAATVTAETVTAPDAVSQDTQPMPRVVPIRHRDDGLDDMTVPDLRALAGRYGVTVRGPKNAIVARLRNRGVTAGDVDRNGGRDGGGVTATRYGNGPEGVTAAAAE